MLFFLVVCITFSCVAQPVINSFSPASGPVGSTLIITGTNFSATAANNIVYIGGVKASVTATTGNTLTVTVPAGALFTPISVTANGLTAYSNKPFIVTFSGGATVFTPQSFAYAIHLDSIPNSETKKHAVGDLDGDNRLDIVTIDRPSNTLSVYRNTTTATGISFASKIDITTGQSPRSVAIADMDGDGKPDVIVTNLMDNTVSVFRNTSSAGAISFAAKVDHATAVQPAAIAVADLDKDGKPDLVINTVNLDGFVSVLRNTGTTGAISFATRIDVQTVGGSIEEVRTADVDGDGRQDIVLPDYATGSIKIFRNTSSSGNISFATATNVSALSWPTDIATGDLNDDGKPDLVVTNFTGNQAMVIKNISTAGNISFQTGTTYADGFTYGLTINDLDGDGKPDLAMSVYATVSLYKNTSTANGNISFSAKVSVPTLYGSDPICGDFDNDGKADISFENGAMRATVYKNRTASPQITYFSPVSAKSGDVVTIKGANLAGITSVTFGGEPAASFVILNETEMTAVVGAGATGDVNIATASDSTSLTGFTYEGPPVVLSFTPQAGAPYEKITIKGQNFKNVTGVTIGNVSVAYTVIDPFTIEVTLWGIAASGEVSVTSIYGTGSKPGFTYVPKPYISSFSPASAMKGDIVYISGVNFTNVTAVSLGGTPAASFVIKNSGSIEAVVGDGATGSVQVTNADGTAEKPGFVFYPPPVITSFTPVEAAEGDTVTITGLHFLTYSGVYNVSFGGYTASAFKIIDSFTIKAKVNAGRSGAVTLESVRGNASLPGFTFISVPVITAVNPTIIGPGAEVTITGKNLARATAVQFGGNAASSFNIVSDTLIKAIVGTAASGNITVITPKHIAQWNVLTYSGNPFIYSISPTSGPVGTTVTITGVNFKPNVADNIVYFGGVKGTVVSAAANTLTVTVPAGATYKPITIVSPSTRQTARSYQFFNVTFPVDPAAFNNNSFAGKMEFATGNAPGFVKQADVDGDGKPDLVMVNERSTFFSIYRNVSTPGRLSFAPRVDIEMGMYCNALTIADMDADGKLDLIISEINTSYRKLHIFRNQSTATNLSFTNAYSISGFSGTGFLETADLDLDGRLDIICQCTQCGGGGGFSYTLNKSTGANFSFDTPVDRYFIRESGVNAGLVVTDYNHDGKPDVIAGVSGSSALYFFRNSLIGNTLFFSSFKYDNYLDYAGYSTGTPFVANFTSQEYPDLVAGYFVLKNNRGAYSEALLNRYIPATSVYDLNGDGKQDILGISYNGDVLILKNTGNNSIAFATPDTVKVRAGYTEIGDLDGDSKPEICIISAWTGNVLTILRNRIGEALPPPPIISAFSPQTQAYVNQVGIKGSNLDQTTAVTFGGVPALYFTIVSNDSIIATVGKGASGAVRVTTPGGTDSLDGFIYIPLPEIKDFTPKGTVKGGAITITGVNFTNVTAVSFGGTPAASFKIIAADTIVAYVGNGTNGTVRVSAPGGIGAKDGFLYYQQPVIYSISPTTVVGGGQTVIFGDHFEGISSVSFGGVAATSFTIYPDFKSIVATVGAGASGDVTVVNPAGSFSLPGFKFVSPFAPSITLFTPASTNAGVTVTIKGKYFTGATAVSFGGVNAAAFAVVDSVTITAVVGAGASGNVSVTTPFGIATSSGFVFNNVTAIVDPANVNSKELTVSPNPARDLLVIKHPVAVKNARLRFINILGREVKVITPAIGSTRSETSVFGLAPGVYTIVWNERTRILSRVFMVQ